MPKPLRILDVGGTSGYWRAVGLPHPEVQIELFNLAAEAVHAPFASIAGDARDLSRYSDNAFDIVFSNSVMGHVGGLSDQLRVASEIRRVGRCYFVQTPNHGFPVDWRTMVPFFHFLPPHAQAWFFERACVGTYRRARDCIEAKHWASRVRNVRHRELALLFPDGIVVNERYFGFTKSFVVHNLGSPP